MSKITKRIDVTILTDNRYTDISDNNLDEYIQNIYTEDTLIKTSLEGIGLKVNRKSWDDKTFNWSTTKFILFRSTWDYFDRFDEFSKWLTEVSKLTILLNSENLVLWNIDKHYLIDLLKKGVHICETYFIEAQTKSNLNELSLEYNLKDFVLKPCISGAARHTYKVKASEVEKYESIFQKLIAKEAMMLQPFQNNIVSKGEMSFMVMNGNFTHAVLKQAKPGDFRVQDDFGGSVQIYNPTKEEIQFAENVVKCCPELPIYARVDVFLDNQNKLALAELELIEPELWFRFFPKSADELAKGIKQRIKKYEEIF